MNMEIDLYEDNAGGLYITDGKTAWGDMSEVQGALFAEDAAALAKGDTDNWTVQRYFLAGLNCLWLVATWEDGNVVIHGPGAEDPANLGHTTRVYLSIERSGR